MSDRMNLDGARVLVVDDNDLVRDTLEDVLTAFGAVAFTLEHATRLTEQARDFDPHVILCDYNLPEVNGLEALIRLREAPGGREVPFILYTARDDDSLRNASLEAGADAFLSKVGDIEALIPLVARLAAA